MYHYNSYAPTALKKRYLLSRERTRIGRQIFIVSYLLESHFSKKKKRFHFLWSTRSYIFKKKSIMGSLKVEARNQRQDDTLDFFHYFCLFSSCLRFQTFHESDGNMIHFLYPWSDHLFRVSFFLVRKFLMT